MVVPVVVQVEHAQQLAVGRHSQLLCLLYTLAERLAGVLLHLNVEKLPVGRTGAVRLGVVVEEITSGMSFESGLGIQLIRAPACLHGTLQLGMQFTKTAI